MKHRLHRAFLGSLVADAVAMPVHWYYDTDKLDEDYPILRMYTEPKNPHPDSILWRSSYQPRNQQADILHEQSIYWGKRNVHYHQFLAAGENTLNYRLAVKLYETILKNGGYDSNQWLETYIRVMRTPGWHQDTYVEEYHRAFFDRLASGVQPKNCGIDDLHIGGLATVPALLAGLSQTESPDPEQWVKTTLKHVALTHHNKHTLEAAETLVRMLTDLTQETGLDSAIENQGGNWVEKFKGWCSFRDRQVIGRHLTPACYLPDSFTASLYLSWKYSRDFKAGVLANALCGGDNCHRGAVVGSILGVINEIPETCLKGLRALVRLNALTHTSI